MFADCGDAAQGAWLASLACSQASSASLASYQHVAAALCVLSIITFTKGQLTHDRFLRRASYSLRRHLVVVVGLCAALLGTTGTFLLLLEASSHLPSWQLTTLATASPLDVSSQACPVQELTETCPVPGQSALASWLSALQWPGSVVHTAVALACMIVAGTSAHGVAGHVLYGARQQDLGGWNFFQPFKVCLGTIAHSIAPATTSWHASCVQARSLKHCV